MHRYLKLSAFATRIPSVDQGRPVLGIQIKRSFEVGHSGTVVPLLFTHIGAPVVRIGKIKVECWLY